MTWFHAKEDRPTPKEVYNWRLYLETAIIATGSILFGYDSAFIGTTIARASFKTSFNISKSAAADISSNITSAFQAGAFFGAIFCYLLTERVGRKWALQANVVVFLVGAILMVAASHQLSYIYAGRVLTGLACGAITATVPSYIAELGSSNNNVSSQGTLAATSASDAQGGEEQQGLSDVIVLLNMLENMPDLAAEVEDGLGQEIGEECGEKYGRVERVYIDVATQRVFIKFTDQVSALRAVNELQGRVFNGNTITPRFYNSEAFEQGVYTKL
ncbi:hypothetical protein NQ176_g2676 [Zarea fungicola]|uniref:Uncharacterized protein n=1 Tax=Zarea fungicola TaxID=93591 RepID=A0ACC1NPN2_9HYPO|nr:hypothetical protein NQ176_g2676 [Lecanicillium fungicola]